MPRSKTRKPKVLTKSDVTRRAVPRRQVNPGQTRPPAGLDRRNRPDVRPPKFPGRLGGR